MTKPLRIPNFRGQRALILHRSDRNCEVLAEQLERLSTYVSVRWPAENISADHADVIFFDSDVGFDGLFAWQPGDAPVPLIAVLGSEAPGRLEWTLSQEPSAYLLKPIGSLGVFSALSIAFHNFALRRQRDAELSRLEQRLQMRAVVVRATLKIMRRYSIGEDTALAILRGESMRRKSTIETICELVADGKWFPPEKDAAGNESKPIAVWGK
jgi:two-component system, response regulator / RNA-binding antiterminator